MIAPVVVAVVAVVLMLLLLTLSLSLRYRCCHFVLITLQVSTFLQKMAIAKTIKEQLAIVATTATAL